MKNILLLFLFISTSIFGQDYDKNWLKVIEYENDGKIKSANEIVSKIQQKASRDKNEVQIIKGIEKHYLFSISTIFQPIKKRLQQDSKHP